MPWKNTLPSALIVLCACFASLASEPADTQPGPKNYRRIADEVDANLRHDVLEKWFPAAVDRKDGGFVENFSEDWTRGDNRERNVVYQARLTWLSAQVAKHDPARSDEFLAISRHGVTCLADKLWDRDYGGFFWAVDTAGNANTSFGTEKHAYGIAFGIFAAAGSYQATRDAATLELAKKAFRWLDEHAHDAKSGGYFEALDATGKPILTPGARPTDAIGTRYGLKSMNTHIHLLEAFTELYAVWPDPAVRLRLDEVFQIVRDRIYAKPGVLHLYLNPDWTPVPGRDSYGHDIETAYLLTEAAAALGKPNDAVAWSAAQNLVDHALENGFDREHGGFFNEGTTDGRQLDRQKVWWVQAEGLNALLLMHERFNHLPLPVGEGRGEGARSRGPTTRYWGAFTRQWDFITHHQTDRKHGGWYITVAAGGTPTPARPKSDRWADAYHQGRALLNVSATLRRLADGKSK